LHPLRFGNANSKQREEIILTPIAKGALKNNNQTEDQPGSHGEADSAGDGACNASAGLKLFHLLFKASDSVDHGRLLGCDFMADSGRQRGLHFCPQVLALLAKPNRQFIQPRPQYRVTWSPNTPFERSTNGTLYCRLYSGSVRSIRGRSGSAWAC